MITGRRIAFSLFISTIAFYSAYAKDETTPALQNLVQGSFQLASVDDDKRADKDDEKKEKKKKKHHDDDAEENQKSEAKAEKKSANGNKSANAVKPAGADAEIPSFQPDQCLISVLKDLSRALKDPEQLKKVTDDNQRAALVVATQVLDKALAEPNLLSDRIIKPEDSPLAESKLTPEAWGSGEVGVSDDLKGSLTAVWAKRLNGSVHLAIAGDDAKTNAPNGKPIGQFVIEIDAKTSMQKGFDIQSQTDVHFWLGEIKNIAVDADCCPATDASAAAPEAPAKEDTPDQNDEKKKSSLVLPVIATSRMERYLAKVREIEEARLVQLRQVPPLILQVTEPTDDVKTAKEETASPASKPEEPKKIIVEEKEPELVTASSPETKQEVKAEVKPETKPETKPEIKPETKAESKDEVKTEIKADARKDELARVGIVPTSLQQQENQDRLASGWGSSPIANTAIQAAASANQPSTDAHLYLPDRAIAGKAITVTVVNSKNQGEADVEVGFNGATVATDSSGRAEFLVPDDATPGRTLHVVLAARPEILPAVVDVLQPLLISPEQQTPRIDAWPSAVTPGQLFVINGHSFDGAPGHSRVILDDFSELPILAVSPVQVKARIPQDMPPGPHNVRVESGGIQSQKAGFNLVTVEVKPEGKDFTRENSNKVRIRVLGTEDKVSLQVTNETPEFVFILRGNDFHITSPGGTPNDIVLPLERLKRGAFKISAKVE